MINAIINCCGTATVTNYSNQFTGNLIPNSWYHSITTKTGRPDSATISILSEIVYWYRPNRVGESKFRGDAWQTSYEHFERKFSYNRETIRRIFVKLEQLGLAHRELRTVGKFGQRYNNVLFIHLNSQQLQLFTGSESKKICTPYHKSYTPSPQTIGDYIENKISFKNISRSDTSNFFANKILKGDNLQQSLEPEIKTIAYSDDSVLNVQEQIILQQQSMKITKKPSIISSISLKSDLVSSYAHMDLKDENYHEHATSSLKSGALLRKPLLSFHPLSEEDAIYLRKTSGRPFNLRYINMLLLNLASKKPDHGFYTKELLLVYMTSALLGEKRDACIVNSESFNFKIKPDSLEYKTNQKKKYLNAIELSRETNILTKIKRRIIGLFNEEDAYNIITNCNLFYLTDNYNPTQYVITAPRFITETATQKERLIQAVQDILGQTVEVIFKEMVDIRVTTTKAEQGYSSTSLIPYNNTNPEPVISSPLWQRVRETLKHLYGNTGEAMDKSWFSKLDIELSEDSKKIYIKCPSYFARDWIKANYYDVIENAIKEISHKTKDMFWNLATLDNVRFEYSAC